MAKHISLGPVTAYALAVRQGFSGTEAQWLASLRGEQGAQGVGVSGAALNGNGHLVLTLSDPVTGTSSTVDAGATDATQAIQDAVDAVQEAGAEAAGTAVQSVQAEGASQLLAIQQNAQGIMNSCGHLSNGMLNGTYSARLTWEAGYINTNTGENMTYGNYLRTPGSCRIYGTQVKAAFDTDNFVLYAFEYDETGVYLRRFGVGTVNVAVNPEYSYRFAYGTKPQTVEIELADGDEVLLTAEYPSYLSETIQTMQSDLSTLSSRQDSRLKGKQINCLGDSLTQRADGWHSRLAANTGCIIHNYGVSGSAISRDRTVDGASVQSFLNRVSTLATDADITVLFGGVNDCYEVWENESNPSPLPIGTLASPHDSTSFTGAMLAVIDAIRARLPGKKIYGVIPPFFCTPESTTLYAANQQVHEAERAVYQYCQIPFVDLPRLCQEMATDAQNVAAYRMSNDMHPNSAGYQAINDVIEPFLEFFTR